MHVGISLARRSGLSTRLVFALTLCLAPWGMPAAEAALHQWSSGGPAITGPVLSFAVDPSNPRTVYAGTGTSGAIAGTVFKSTDNGQSWNIMNTNLPSSFVRGLAINPQATNTIYAAAGTVYKSTDGAGSWTPKNAAPAPGSAQCLTLDPQNPNTVFVGTTASPPNNMFKSTNGGDVWEAVGGPFQGPNSLPNGIVSAVAVDPSNSSIVYAGTQFGMYKSIDGGHAWSAMNNGFTPDPTPAILAVVIDRFSPSTVYAGTGGFGVWKSADGGATWVRKSDGLTGSNLIQQMVMDPQRPNVLYVATATSGVFRTITAAESWAAFNNGLTPLTLSSIGISGTGTCVHTGINSGPNSHAFDYSIVADCGALPPAVPPLIAAVLPSSRSVQVNHVASAFVTIINSGSSVATGVTIGLGSAIPGSFSFQTTDPNTNQPVGTPNVPVDIPAGGFQTFIIALTPSTSVPSTDVVFVYAGENTTAPATTLVGVNTLLLSAAFGAVPDIVALAATLTNDGRVVIPGTNGTGAFSVATANVGSGALITASADTGGATVPVNLFICQTDAGGQCISALAQSIQVQINGGETPTFTVLVQGHGDVVFDPANVRIFVRYVSGGVTRGATSVAPQTVP